jgi:hypothetical protein
MPPQSVAPLDSAWRSPAASAIDLCGKTTSTTDQGPLAGRPEHVQRLLSEPRPTLQ